MPYLRAYACPKSSSPRGIATGVPYTCTIVQMLASASFTSACAALEIVRDVAAMISEVLTIFNMVNFLRLLLFGSGIIKADLWWSENMQTNNKVFKIIP